MKATWCHNIKKVSSESKLHPKSRVLHPKSVWPNWIKVTQSQVTVSKSIAILITLCKEPCDQIVYKSRYHKIDPSQVFAPKTCPKLGWKQPKESPSCSHITLAISHPTVWRTIKEIVRVGKYPELGTSNLQIKCTKSSQQVAPNQVHQFEVIQAPNCAKTSIKIVPNEYISKSAWKTSYWWRMPWT